MNKMDEGAPGSNRANERHVGLREATVGDRRCTAEQGVSKEETLKRGMETKSKEFLEKGVEVCVSN